MNNRSESDNRTDQDFNLYHNIRELPMGEHPSYIKEGVGGVCTGGSALVNVASTKHRLVKNELLILFPYQLASISKVSDDFEITFFKVPYELFFDTLSGMCRMSPSFFFYMRQHFTYKVDEEEATRFLHFCNLLKFRTDGTKRMFRRESIMYLLRIFYFDIYISYRNDPEAVRNQKYSHKEDIAFNFFRLVTQYYTENREVSFYADKLCVSPKYLTMVIKDVFGQSAKEYIVDYVLLEIKSLLRDSTLDIKEIVARMKFPNQSLMSRFFRKHTGMSPSQYRMKIHF